MSVPDFFSGGSMMQRVAVCLVLLTGVLLAPIPGHTALDGARLARVCPANAEKLLAILETAKRAGLPVDYLETRINEGLLRKIPCPRLVQVLEQEYAILGETRTLLGSIHDTSDATLVLFSKLRSSGLERTSLISLIAVFGQTRNPGMTAAAGLFLLSMKELNWSEDQILPLASLIAASSWNSEQRESIKQILLYGASLDIERHQTVELVRNGLARGRSFHQIRRDLLDRKPFKLENQNGRW